MKQKTLRCDCIGGTHYLDVKFFEEDDGEQGYFEIVDDVLYRSFWERVKLAANIVLRRDVSIDCIILQREKVKELILFLQKQIGFEDKER